MKVENEYPGESTGPCKTMQCSYCKDPCLMHMKLEDTKGLKPTTIACPRCWETWLQHGIRPIFEYADGKEVDVYETYYPKAVEA